ncbi:MAG: ribosome maturation factor [Chitinophagaceae bacterium]|nr:ribosome maturation factor [Chitinophagaceae bacterium]
METQVQAVERMVEGILADDPQYFLVEVKIRPTNNIKVYLDGDNGISIDKCISYNRRLYKMIEESGIVPADDFSLEVSSPGLDEPLKLYRQYKKNIGRKVEVIFKEANKEETPVTGIAGRNLEGTAEEKLTGIPGGRLEGKAEGKLAGAGITGGKLEGILKDVNEQGITVEEARSKKPARAAAHNTAGGKSIPSKKKELIEHKISFESIKSTKIQIVF